MPKIEVTSIVRIKIEDNMDSRNIWIDFLSKDGWKIISFGPKVISFPEVDPETVVIIAEIKTENKND